MPPNYAELLGNFRAFAWDSYQAHKSFSEGGTLNNVKAIADLATAIKSGFDLLSRQSLVGDVVSFKAHYA